MIAASRAIEARELFEEGFHIPLTHLIREGRVDETLVALLRELLSLRLATRVIHSLSS